MTSKPVRKSLQLDNALADKLTDVRIQWHTSHPSRIKELNGMASENAFLKGLLTLSLELVDEPEISDKLWQIIRSQ